MHKDVAKEVSYSSIYHIINNYNLYKDVDLIDVRDTDSFNNSHLIGSRNVLYNELEDIEYDSNVRVIVYSYNRNKSIAVCRKLRRMGIDADYIPGINNYPYDLV